MKVAHGRYEGDAVKTLQRRAQLRYAVNGSHGPLSVAVQLIIGKAAGLDVGDVTADGLGDAIGVGQEVPHEPGHGPVGQPQHVVENQNLPGACTAGANANYRDPDARRQIGCHGTGHEFQDQQLRAGLGDGVGMAPQFTSRPRISCAAASVDRPWMR